MKPERLKAEVTCSFYKSTEQSQVPCGSKSNKKYFKYENYVRRTRFEREAIKSKVACRLPFVTNGAADPFITGQQQYFLSCFLPLHVRTRRLPASQAEQQALQKSGLRNRRGGYVLLTVLFGSLFWTVVLSIKELSS